MRLRQSFGQVDCGLPANLTQFTFEKRFLVHHHFNSIVELDGQHITRLEPHQHAKRHHRLAEMRGDLERNIENSVLKAFTPVDVIVTFIRLHAGPQLGCYRLERLQRIDDIEIRRIKPRQLQHKRTHNHQISPIHKRGKLGVNLPVLEIEIDRQQVFPGMRQGFVQPVTDDFNNTLFGGGEFCPRLVLAFDIAAVIGIGQD